MLSLRSLSRLWSALKFQAYRLNSKNIVQTQVVLFSGHILNTILILDVFIARCEFILHWILQGLLATWTIHKYYSILKQLRSHFLDYFKKNKTHIFLPFTPIISFINISQTYIMSRTQTLSTAHLVSMINSIQVTSMCSLSPTNINTYFLSPYFLRFHCYQLLLSCLSVWSPISATS